jgi:serine/threonine protein kinase
LNDDPIRPDQRLGIEISDDLQNILMGCLRKNPDERPCSAEDLADALLQCRDAAAWSMADACQWWESVFEGPRDDLDDFRDNSRLGQPIVPPMKGRLDVQSGRDSTNSGPHDQADPYDQTSEKTIL